MKVLHIGNTAGIASIIAKNTDKLYGTKSLVIDRKANDVYGVTTYGELKDYGPTRFGVSALLLAWNFDVIHVHYADKFLAYLKYYWRKGLIMHYHGDDIRGKWRQKEARWRVADHIFYSSLDCFLPEDGQPPETASLLPNPVDTELFNNSNYTNKDSRKAVTFSHWADDLAKEIADKYDLDLTIIGRLKPFEKYTSDETRLITNPIPYTEMPNLLKQYGYYIEVKRNFEGKLLGKGNIVSTIALQSLACGLKVIKWDGTVMKDLPTCHLPENTAKEVMHYYSDTLQKRV
jgi:glycosyltransferase involved in cell wall biosynthesis